MECWHRYKTLVLIASVTKYLFDVKVSLFQNNIQVVTCKIYIQIHFFLFPLITEITQCAKDSKYCIRYKNKVDTFTGLVPPVKYCRDVSGFPAAPLLKEVYAYSAIYSSDMQIAKAACGNLRPFGCLSPNCVSYCKTAAHLSGIKKEEGSGEELGWGGGKQ